MSGTKDVLKIGFGKHLLVRFRGLTKTKVVLSLPLHCFVCEGSSGLHVASKDRKLFEIFKLNADNVAESRQSKILLNNSLSVPW